MNPTTTAPETLKVCNICKQPKRRDEMKKDSRRVDGLAGHCTSCAAKTVKRWKLQNTYRPKFASSIRDSFIQSAF